MPLPLSAVRRLSDYNGAFVLGVLCLDCQHERPLSARKLAQIVGPEARVVDVVKRLRCTRCRGKSVDVVVAGIPR